MAISDYHIVETLYHSNQSIIYRAVLNEEGQPDEKTVSSQHSVILKMLNTEYPSPKRIAGFQREYEITKTFKLDGVIKVYGQETYQNRPVIILEDIGGRSLAEHLLTSNTKDPLKKSGRPPHNFQALCNFLKTAIQVAEILGQIHHCEIIHKDINPSNIIWNPETNQLRIIDFGISSELSREHPAILNPNVLEGTLGYISPEQTGRMNRSIDYRTDLYSLGAMFYHMLTGQQPFHAEDNMEMVHCHIAKTPPPPHEINPVIPPILSQIILKLMSKSAEDRYQNTFGLNADLQLCLDQLSGVPATGTPAARGLPNNTQPIEPFIIGSKDVSNRFQIPQQLYGREKEREVLLHAFDHVCEGGLQMMLVTGYSGVGKSALVHEVHKPIVQKKGYFIEGKFEQFQRDFPYSAIIQAFRGLVHQLLGESESQLENWKQKLKQAFGPNGNIILDLIPEVERIVGQQPPLQELPPLEAQNRFLFTFRSFIQVFAQKTHPIVLFLDDLQWSDISSLNLVKDLLTSIDTEYFFIIGAYRNNDVEEGHPLLTTIDEINRLSLNKPILQLILKPLEQHTINQIIVDTLHRSFDYSKSLAELIFQKTEGNPFFVNELLKNLHKEGYLFFLHDQGQWEWDLEQIKKIDVSDNVVEFMIKRLKSLPSATQKSLQYAACIGNQFDLKTLAVIEEQSPLKVAKSLWDGIYQGIIVPLNNDYRLLKGLV